MALPIILDPDPSDTLHEQALRLWRRKRTYGALLVANVVAALGIWLGLTLGLTVAGIYLTERGVARGCVPLVVLGAIIARRRAVKRMVSSTRAGDMTRATAVASPA